MMLRSGRCRPLVRSMGGGSMIRFVGLDVSQKLTAICIVDDSGIGCGAVSAPQTQGRSSG